MSRKAILVLACLTAAITCGLRVPAGAFAQDAAYAEGEVIVKFAPQVTAVQADGIIASLGGQKVQDFPRIGASLVRLQGMTVAEAVALYAQSPQIAYIEPNYYWHIDNTPDDPDFGLLWGMHNTGQTGGVVDADIDAPEAWDLFTGSTGIIVGVIDTGIDYTHPDLAANIWVNAGEIPANGLDDDGNGWIDDIHGWDALHEDGDPRDDNGHGTHCAGTIGAVGNNTAGVAGVNWTVRIMALKFLDASGGGYTADAVECLAYAVAMGAKVTSNSWGGGPYSTALEDAIADADAAGQLFVAAAGNSGQDNDVYANYPSNYTVPNVIAVGATDPADGRVNTGLWASSYGATSVDIGAPGLDVWSTVPNGGYAYKSGTSMATPHVSGALALLMGKYPTMPAHVAKTVLINSADPKPQLTGLWVSGGRLNVATMMAGLDTIPPGQVQDLQVAVTASSWVQLQWTATGDDGALGTAAAYDVRYATYPLDETNFAAAPAVAQVPPPAAAGLPDTLRVPDLVFDTVYYFALKVLDEYGNAGPLSNLAQTVTLGVPAVQVSPSALSVALDTGQQALRTVTVANTGAGILDFAARAVPADPTASALREAAAAVVEGLDLTDWREDDGRLVPALSAETIAVLQSRLDTFTGAVAASAAADVLPIIGVGGYSGYELLNFLLVDPQLAGLFVFDSVDYLVEDLTPFAGLIIAEYDHGISASGAAILRDFFDSGRPVFIGMDDFDDIWSGDIPALLGPMLGISQPVDGDFCTASPVNPDHPITETLPGASLGGSWCNENDSFGLDGADWLFQDGATGRYHGVAFQGLARSVTMGENLAAVWYANEQLNVNAVLWMMGQSALPTVDPAFGSVAAGTGVDLDVLFDANSLCTDVYLADILITSNDPAVPLSTVTTEMAVTGTTDIEVSATAFDFGAVFVNGSAQDTLLVRNPGCEPLSVTAIAVDSPHFHVDTTPFSLAPGDRRELILTFDPTVTGPLTGTLTLDSDDPDEPSVAAALQGEGLLAPVIAVSPTSLATSLLTGQTDTRILTIGNQGGSALEFRIGTAETGTSASPPAADSARILNLDAQNAPAPGSAGYAAATAPTRDPLPLPSEALDTGLAADLELLILGTGDFTEMQSQLLAFSDITVVDVFDTYTAVPTLADLLPYDVAILASGYAYSNPTAVGDVLADYLDQGGGVIQTIASFVLGFEVRGRFYSDGYAAFDFGYGPVGSGWLGSFDGSHPIMADVTTVTGDLLATAPLLPGAEAVAFWDWGEAFVATQNTNVVGINAYFANPGYWMGDLPLILHNAVLWCTGAGYWLRPDPDEGVLAPGEQLEVQVVFDATNLCTDTYLADLVVESNDPVTPRAVVAAQMSVQGQTDIAVSDSLIVFDEVFLGTSRTDTLVITNPGCELLIVDGVSVDSPEFAAIPGPFGILPGGEVRLAVTCTPAALGAKSAVLTIACNDPDEPVVTVLLTAEAVAPPIAGIDPASLALSLVPGEVQTRTLTVSNDGGADLVWSLTAAPRDSVAAAMRAAAAAVVADLQPVPVTNEDGEQVLALDPAQTSLLADRLADYEAAALGVGAGEWMPTVGVGGDARLDLMTALLGSPELAGRFLFTEVDYAVDDLTGLHGMVVAEYDHGIDEGKAAALSGFFASGRPIFLGMDDFDDIWSGTLPALLGPIFGIAGAFDADLCANAVLNPAHPINDGLGGFVIGGTWCNDNDAFVRAGADWLVQESVRGEFPALAHSSLSRTVLMGENLAYIWTANAQQNANAVIWMMGATGLPALEPSAGILPAGQAQDVVATFDAANLCGGLFPSAIILASNDPFAPVLAVPVDLTVTGEPDIAVSDTLLDWGQVFLGAAVADTLRIYNRSCGLLEISCVSDDPAFTCPGGPLLVDGQADLALAVVFTPPDSGSHAGILTITANDPDEPVVTVALVGTAVMGPKIDVDPASFAAILPPGQTDTRTLTIGNLGDADLIWQIGVSPRDSLAVLLQSAAAAVVAGIDPLPAAAEGGESAPTLDAGQVALLEQRLEIYDDLVMRLQAEQGLPVIAVGGASSYLMMTYLLAEPALTGLYGFSEVYYPSADLSPYAGLIVAEGDGVLYEERAAVLRDFHDSGRPVMLGMDDLNYNWSGTIPGLVGPVFGIAAALQGDLCFAADLNPDHPVTQGLPGFTVGGNWCNDNDHFQLAGADWLFADSQYGQFYGVAHEAVARSILMGENLAGIWTVNRQLNTNAVIWMMESAGLPEVDPRSGIVPAGQTAPVLVTFLAPEECGRTFLSDIRVTSNDPLDPLVTVPVTLQVLGEPHLALSDTALTYPTLYVGESAVDSLTITNDGCAVLEVAAVAAAPGAFSVSATPFSLAVGQSRVLTVTFAPATAGPIAGQLTLQSNDPQSPLAVVDLYGEGAFPPEIAVDPASLAATVAPAATWTEFLTVMNHGAGTLEFAATTATLDKVSLAATAAASLPIANTGDGGLDRSAAKAARSAAEAAALPFAGAAGSAPAAAAAATPVADKTATGIAVLLLGSGQLGQIQSELSAFPEISAVDIFDTRYVEPALADLLPYNVVILANNYPFADPVATGDVIADYIDLGGGVVQTEPSFVSGYALAGRFWDEGYSAFTLGTDPTGVGTLGNFLPSHPLMAGVSAVWGDLLCLTNLAPGASWAASWSNGRNLVATQGSQVVGVNVFVAYPGHWGEDAAVILRNAAVWVAGTAFWLEMPVTSGAVAPGGSLALEVIFTPKRLPAGDYAAEIRISTNDPRNPQVLVPVLMHVGAAAEPVEVRILARTGSLADTGNVLGAQEGATDGYDGALDLPEPSPPPSNYLSAYFPHPEWGSPFGERFMTDLRASYDPGLEARSWDFRVQTDSPDSVVLEFTPAFPADGRWQLRLHDHTTGSDVDLLSGLRYTFLPGGDDLFTISLGAVLPPLEPPLRWLAGGWALVGTPLQPLPDPGTWADVLLDDAPPLTYLYSYDPTTGYTPVVGSTSVVPGHGLWAAAIDSFTWTMEGEPDLAPIPVSVQEGWNILGYPLWFPGSVDGIQVQQGGLTYSWSEAVLAGLVSPLVYDYDQDLADYVATSGLQAWRGYWLAAHQPDLTLVFDYRLVRDAAAAIPAGSPTLALGATGGAAVRPAVTADKTLDPAPWALTVSTGAGTAAAQVSFGQAVGATAGFDAAFDLPAPPISPRGAPAVGLAILHQEWSLAVGDRFCSDVTALGDGPLLWEIIVRAAKAGPAVLSWDSATLPADLDLQVYLPLENRVLGTVRGMGSVTVQAGTLPVPVQFRTPDAASEVPWRQAGLQLRNVPNPFNPTTEFRFNLPEAGRAAVRIYDLRGSLVCEVDGGVQPAGPAVLRWQGREADGAEAASGVYFYRLYLDGRHLGDTQKMSLVR